MIQQEDSDFFSKMDAIESSWQAVSTFVKDSESLLASYLEHYRSSKDKNFLNEEITDFTTKYRTEIMTILEKDFRQDINQFIKEIIRNFVSKMKRVNELEVENNQRFDAAGIYNNIECAFKASLYMYYRYLSNSADKLNLSIQHRTALYFFLRLTCYSSMFRYNKNGDFNVPYGGISYNSKSFQPKIDYYKLPDLVDRLQSTIIGNDDFYSFMQQHVPQKGDFIFLDPPYDSEFSTYAKNTFGKDDQKRLADYLINECQGNFMLIIKNTDYIASLYPESTPCANGDKIYLSAFSKTYLVSFKNRNDKNVQHLLITNYPLSQ